MTDIEKTNESLQSIQRLKPVVIICIISGLVMYAWLPFDVGLRGVIVETHPLFWVVIVLTIFYVFKYEESNFLRSLIIFIVGLSIRLLTPFHSFYPGAGPWMELGSIHFIRQNGFDIRGRYYHSSMPVLQGLIILMGQIISPYSVLVYAIPILSWTLNYVILHKILRQYFTPNQTFAALLAVSTANVLFESTARAETLALPIGMTLIYVVLRKNLDLSYRDFLIGIALFVFLTFTHHLTSGAIVFALGALTLGEKYFRGRVPKRFLALFLIAFIFFFLYWEGYQGLVSQKLAVIDLSKQVLPTPWPKPLWWWGIFLAPKSFCAALVSYFIFKVLLSKVRDPVKERFMAISSIGSFLNVLAVLMPGGYLVTRVFHQFFGYHTLGISNLRSSEFLLKVLALLFILGLLADFPIIDRKGQTIGGHWFSHSQDELEAVKFLTTATAYGSRVVIDARIESLIYVFAPRWRVIPKQEPQVFESDMVEDAYSHSLSREYDYVLVSTFYQTMFIFNQGTDAKRFSQEQLSKFGPPFFLEVFRNDEVIVYRVNRETEK